MASKRNTPTHRTRGGDAGYYIFRAWKLDPKTGEKLYPPDGKKAWKIWVPTDPTKPKKPKEGAK